MAFGNKYYGSSGCEPDYFPQGGADRGDYKCLLGKGVEFLQA